MKERQKYHPGLNIVLSLEKACKDYWATEVGWKRKKAYKTVVIDWKRTLNFALTQDCNKVWKTREQTEKENEQKRKVIHI
jgi:hypothetical protein